MGSYCILSMSAIRRVMRAKAIINLTAPGNLCSDCLFLVLEYLRSFYEYQYNIARLEMGMKVFFLKIFEVNLRRLENW